MAQPMRAVIGPFNRGLNAVTDPRVMAPGEGTIIQNASMTAGVLEGFWSPGTAIDSVDAGARFLFWHEGAGWLSDTYTGANGYMNWALRDTPRDSEAISYLTNIDPNTGTPGNPVIRQAATSGQLGLVAPAAAPTSSGGSLGNKQFAYTYVIEDGSGVALYESNPSPYSATVVGGGTLTLVNSSDGRVTHKYIYGTQEGDPSGTLYYLNKVTGTSYVDAGAIDTDVPLLWDAGGNLDDDVTPYDHSPAPALTCLSDKVHGSEAGTSGGGIVFGASGTDAVWCQTGNAWYWPSVNRYPLQGVTQAITSLGASTFYFLEDQIWAFSGAHSTAISATLTGVTEGVRVGCGRTVVATPYGVIYLARDGLRLFDGSSSQVIAGHLLNAWSFNTYVWAGAYFDGFYFLSRSETTLAVDLRSLPDVSVVELPDVHTRANHVVASPLADNIDPGLYLADYDSGDVQPWRPFERELVAGSSRMEVTWKTGLIDCGAPSHPKRARKFRINGTGPVTVKFFSDPEFPKAPLLDTPAFTLEVADASVLRHYKLPETVKGRYFQLQLELGENSSVSHCELEVVAS